MFSRPPSRVSIYQRFKAMHSSSTGLLQDTTDEGLVAGLGSMTALRILKLHNAAKITDGALSALAETSNSCKGCLPQGRARVQPWYNLVDLSITHALCITDAGLASLASLPALRRCFVSGSAHVSKQGMQDLSAHVDRLEFRACQNA